MVRVGGRGFLFVKQPTKNPPKFHGDSEAAPARAYSLLRVGFEQDSDCPFLDRRSGDSYSYGFLLTGDFHLWLSELFNPTIGVELKRMGSAQEWPQRPVGLFLNEGAPKDAGV